MSDILHGHKITTESFYEGKVTNTKQELEVSVFTDKQSILKEVITALSMITTGQTNKMMIEVCLDNKKRYRLIKRFVVE